MRLCQCKMLVVIEHFFSVTFSFASDLNGGERTLGGNFEMPDSLCFVEILAHV